MNLIVKLGGYRECMRLRDIKAASSFRIRGIEFTREQLERAMLLHRRVHNIFEPGDKVVSSYSAMLMEYGDGCETQFDLRHAKDEEIERGYAS